MVEIADVAVDAALQDLEALDDEVDFVALVAWAAVDRQRRGQPLGDSVLTNSAMWRSGPSSRRRATRIMPHINSVSTP